MANTRTADDDLTKTEPVDLTGSPKDWLNGGEAEGFMPPPGTDYASALPLHDLEGWLRSTFERELPDTLQKAFNYGSADLEVMAGAMAALIPNLSHEQALETAVGFYALGKVARLFGALRDGRTPDPDSWYDLHIYALMGLKIQQTGSWL